MSKNEEQKLKLEEEVVVNENQTTALVEVTKDDKKAKMVGTAKKVGKFVGIALLGGVVGYLCGVNKANKYDEDDYDETEISEVADSDAE